MGYQDRDWYREHHAPKKAAARKPSTAVTLTASRPPVRASVKPAPVTIESHRSDESTHWSLIALFWLALMVLLLLIAHAIVR